ncbi:helix-turn-helix transcriptional regulator [Cupriavidus oxalaticus]|uniref:Helix-turn-helix transcriptional regulator n=1 Tax=Cupriavidus oxalaticus TaxID=96344 RepID=A0ABX7HZU9_9BURK|nr:helix-turn-helix transcriptional regulator [Cupriavidus oxalaticus]QRQ95762.1 helix-turn-helix transcriptional regulator [Cupriavidus oxalaticus]
MIRLHIFHHAAEGPVFGLGIIEELRHHGYEMSAGTLVPHVARVGKERVLTSRHQGTARCGRRLIGTDGQ